MLEAALRARSPRPGPALPAEPGHPIEVGHAFIEDSAARPARPNSTTTRTRPGPSRCPGWRRWSAPRPSTWPLHDAYGMLHGVPTYETYNAQFMNADLADYLEPRRGVRRLVRRASIPADFLVRPRPETIPAWHLVGGKDPIDPSELTGAEPDDGYPVLLRDWIRARRPEMPEGQAPRRRRRLGLRPPRSRSARSPIEEGVDWLTADFNCTVREPAYVNAILDRLMRRTPAALRDDPLRRAAVPLRSGGPSHRRPQRFGAQAAVHGRECARLAVRPAGPHAGLDRRGAQDLQDADGRTAVASAGRRPTA